MKQFTYLLIFFVVTFSSCKKEDQTIYHQLVYEITFLDAPQTGSSNFIDATIKPVHYKDIKFTNGAGSPPINRFNLPKIWRYEFDSLKAGQQIMFAVNAQLSYHFQMKVYIDGVEKSYREVIVSDYNYYDDHVLETRGLNDVTDDVAVIKFTYLQF